MFRHVILVAAFRRVLEPVVLPGADHGFDQSEKSAFSTLEFDADRRDYVRQVVRRILEAENLL